MCMVFVLLDSLPRLSLIFALTVRACTLLVLGKCATCTPVNECVTTRIPRCILFKGRSLCTLLRATTAVPHDRSYIFQRVRVVANLAATTNIKCVLVVAGLRKFVSRVSRVSQAIREQHFLPDSRVNTILTKIFISI